MAPALALAGISAIPQLVKGISGIFGIARGKRMARNNKFPVEGVNQNFVQNSAEADQMARVGMPQQQYNNQLEAINSGQSAGVRMLNRSSNPSASIASIVRQGNLANNQLNAQDAQTRTQNQRYAIGQRGILGNEQNRVWDWNNRQRFLQNAQAAAQTINAGRQNAFGALDNLTSLGMSALGGQGGEAGGIGNSYMNNRLKGSLITGYGMNPYTPNA